MKKSEEPEGLRSVCNYAYDLMSERERRQLDVGETVTLDELNYLAILEFDENDDAIQDALERSADELGYAWSNDEQRYVKKK